MLVFVQNDFDIGATIRRLSTASYVTDPENTMATQWTWYWKDEHETWRKYDQDQGVSYCISSLINRLTVMLAVVSGTRANSELGAHH